MIYQDRESCLKGVTPTFLGLGRNRAKIHFSRDFSDWKNKELNFEFLDRMRNVWQDRILTAIFVTFVNLLMFRHFSVTEIKSTAKSEVTTTQVNLHRPLKELIISKFQVLFGTFNYHR